MKSLFIGSDLQRVGKSLVCICMGKTLQRKGLRIGYFKPCGTAPCGEGGELRDEDAVCLISQLGIQDDPSDVSPIVLTHDFRVKVLRGKVKGVRETVIEKYKKVSQGKDVMLVEGGRTMHEGMSLDFPAEEWIREFDSGLIYVETYDEDRGVDSVLAWKQKLGERFLGLILNRINPDHEEYLEKFVVPFLERKGVPVLGMLLNDSLISAVSVRDLAEALEGKVIAAEKHQDKLVQHFMIGAMSMEAAGSRFRKIHNKAVITGGDRTDLQVASLESSIRCLILTGGISPHPMILSKAEEMKVPIILVSDDTLGAFEKIDHMIRRPRIWEPEKLERAMELFGNSIKLDRLGV